MGLVVESRSKRVIILDLSRIASALDQQSALVERRSRRNLAQKDQQIENSNQKRGLRLARCALVILVNGHGTARRLAYDRLVIA